MGKVEASFDHWKILLTGLLMHTTRGPMKVMQGVRPCFTSKRKADGGSIIVKGHAQAA